MVEPSSGYIERVNGFEGVLGSCIELSRKLAGIRPPSSRHFYASVLFTSLCSRGVSLAIVAPHSKWAQRRIEHWDYASMAGMARSILEIRLAFFYLCIDECSSEEWVCRWNLFNLHDCQSRIRLFSMQSEARSIAGFEKQANELRERLTSNSFFAGINLSDKKRN